MGAGTGVRAGETTEVSDRERLARTKRGEPAEGAGLPVSGRKQKPGVSKGEPGTGSNEPIAIDSGQVEGRPEAKELRSGLTKQGGRR